MIRPRCGKHQTLAIRWPRTVRSGSQVLFLKVQIFCRFEFFPRSKRLRFAFGVLSPKAHVPFLATCTCIADAFFLDLIAACVNHQAHIGVTDAWIVDTEPWCSCMPSSGHVHSVTGPNEAFCCTLLCTRKTLRDSGLEAVASAHYGYARCFASTQHEGKEAASK